MINVGIPPEFQVPIAFAEVIGGACLIVGILTRMSSGLLATIMIGAIIIKQLSMPFEIVTIQMDLILLSICIFILVVGSGKVSIVKKIDNIPKILT